jgi:tRNA splicing ligase
MAEILRDIFYRKTSKETRDAMMEYAKTNDVSFVFECIDPERDPHIIEYREEKLVLLDIIENTIDTPRKLSYDELKSQAETFGLPCKKLGYVIENAKDFFAWYQSVLDEDYTYEGDQIEGFVIEDQRGFMVKLKLTYYNFWKFMRNVSQVILKNGHIDGSFTSKFTTPLANYFYAWLLTQYNPETRLDRPESIISLRRRFFESEQGKQFSDKKGESTE